MEFYQSLDRQIFIIKVHNFTLEHWPSLMANPDVIV